MKLVRGLDAGGAMPGGSVVTVGNFDGVHRGHQALLQRLRGEGAKRKLPVAVVTFEPLPAEFFSPERAPARLYSLAEKLEALRAAGAEAVHVLRFNRRLAAVGPEAFAERVLVRALAARVVLVGDDFRFGRDRAGDLGLLQSLGARHGFTAEGMASVTLDGQRISSSAVRHALAAGDLERAERLLGRPYAICRRVVRGERLGRRLGYPTANLPINRRPAMEGVFAVSVEGAGPDPLPGVASLGTRPTVGGTRRLLEVHLFDFEDELYERRLKVAFVHKLRDEHHFDSLEALVEQMRADEREAREILTRR